MVTKRTKTMIVHRNIYLTKNVFIKAISRKKKTDFI